MQVRLFEKVNNPRNGGAGFFQPLEAIFELIQGADPELIAMVQAIRDTPDQAERERLKRNTLPVVQFQHGEGGTPNPLLVIDWEGDTQRMAIVEDSIVLKFQSPSGGNRYGVVIRLPDQAAATWEAYNKIAKAVEAMLDVASSNGQASHDRVRFLSYDPQARYNPEAVPFMTPQEAPPDFLPNQELHYTDAFTRFISMRANGSTYEEAFESLRAMDRTKSNNIHTDERLAWYCKKWEATSRVIKETTGPKTDPAMDLTYEIHREATYTPLDCIVTTRAGLVPVLFRGGITNVVGASKSGKTAVLSALVKCAAGGLAVDAIGFRGTNPVGAVLWFDMELERVLCQKILKTMPPCVRMYSLRGMGGKKAKEIAQRLIRELKPAMVVIDTAADLTSSPNEEDEVSELVGYLMNQADEGRAVLSTMHFNPGSETKTRGHLGSSLERKVTHQLKVAKEGDEEAGVRVISSQFARMAAIKPIYMAWVNDGFDEVKAPPTKADDMAARRERIINSLPDTVSGIAAREGLHPDTVKLDLWKLRDFGRAEYDKKTRFWIKLEGGE